ncbi:hypothetical protein F4861DRAFT_509651 [Xylaria intraflava]|nr:hypothetical protein F4861DRAFT_509651 [Xylaria intraflava]
MEATHWKVQDGFLTRIAQHLEALPFELIAPILGDVPFFRAIDLWASAGPRLREAIQYHPNWAGVFDGDSDELEYLWESLNKVAWLQCRSSWTRMNARRLEVGDETGDTVAHLVAGVFPSQLPHISAMLWLIQIMPGIKIHYYEEPYHITNDEFISCLRWEWQNSFLAMLGLRRYKGVWMAASELHAILHYLPPDSSLAKLVKVDMAPQGEELSAEFVENLTRRLQESERSQNTSKDLLDLHDAYSRLFQEQSAELNLLADLYERFPRFLKVVGAPEQPTNESHVLARLRYDAGRRRKIPYWHLRGVYPGRPHNVKSLRTSHRFRYPHPGLVPFEWCLRLFKAVAKQPKVEDMLPQYLRTHFERAMDGVDLIYCHTHGKRLKRTEHSTSEHAVFAKYPFANSILPKPRAEIDWLESFVTVTEWMAKEFPDITLSAASSHLSVLRRRRLADPSDYRLFAQLESPRVIAKQLRADLRACRAGLPSALPSCLALYVPSWPSPRATGIARALAPHHKCNEEFLQPLYESVISEICRVLSACGVPGAGGFFAADENGSSRWRVC